MTTVTKYTASGAAAAEVDRHARAYLSEHHVTSKEALNATLAANKDLAKAYAQPASPVATTATKPTVPVPTPLAQGKT